MKEKKVKKAPTVAEQITLSRVSAIFWVVLCVIWTGLGIAKLVTDGEWWMIALDFFVGVLSGVDAYLGFVRLKKLKKAQEGETVSEDTVNQD